MRVANPLVDLRAQPFTSAEPSVHDPLQETQLFYGERVRLRRKRDGWAYVEALEQPEFTHAGRWQGYPGWVPLSALAPWQEDSEPTVVVTSPWVRAWKDAFGQRQSDWQFPMGTYLQAMRMGNLWRVNLMDGSTVWLSEDDVQALKALNALAPAQKRRPIVQAAERLIGHGYYWGGRSPQILSNDPTGWVTGVDCSGLVQLAHRAVGIEVPRDSHEQFLRAQSVERLQPADLIFLSDRVNSNRIVHVMLYAGGDWVIEGPGTGGRVRRIRLEDRLGKTADALVPGTEVDGQIVRLGSFLQ